MTDATLGFRIDSSGLALGIQNLEKLTNAAKKAEAAAAGVSSSTSATGKAAASAASGFDAESSAATKAAASLTRHAAAANQNVVALKGLSGQTGNIAAQFQDIGVQLAGGQSPFLIALQQGTQLSAVLGTVGGGARGVGAALGAAFSSILSPVSLLTIGVIALGGYLLQMFTNADSGASKTANTLKQFDALIEKIGQTSQVTADKMKAMIDQPQSWAATLADILQVKLGLESGLTPALENAASQLQSVGIANRAAFGMSQDVLRTRGAVAELGRALEDGSMSAQAVYEKLSQMANAETTPASLKVLILQLREAVGEAANLQRSLNALSGAGVFTQGRVEGPAKLADAAANTGQTFNLSARMGGESTISNGLVEALNAQKRSLENARKVPKARGGGGMSEEDTYKRVVQSANERIASLKVEQSALGMTAEAASKLRTEQQLINQVQGVGKNITAGQREELGKLAGEMARIEAATKRAKEQMDFAKNATKGFLSDLRSGLAQGQSFFQSFGQAALNVLDKVISKIEDQLVDALFSIGGVGGKSSGGGLFGSILGGIGSLFGFAEGGYTGGGSASSVKGVVHGGEYVFSKKATDRIGVGNLEAMHRSAKGYASGGYVAPSNQNNGSQQVSVQVGVTVDNEGSIKAYVKSVTTKEVQAAAPKIVAASRQQIMPTIADYQSKTAGGDYRG